MAVCYIDKFKTALDASLTTGATSITLPSAEVARIEAALEDDGPLITGMEEHHYVPLVVDNGTDFEVLRAIRVTASTIVDVVRSASPITANVGATVRCSALADFATVGHTWSTQTSESIKATPGGHIVSTATFSPDFYIHFDFIDGGFSSTNFLRHSRLPAVVEIHNTTGGVRGVNLIPGGGSLVTRWLDGTAKLSIPADVKVALFEFRHVFPASSRGNVGHLLARADFFK